MSIAQKFASLLRAPNELEISQNRFSRIKDRHLLETIPLNPLEFLREQFVHYSSISKAVNTMGTRHLTMVILNKKVCVAQYGQWDGYPEGQGRVVNSFIAKFLKRDSGLERFKKAVAECKFLTAEEIKKTWVECGANPNSDMVNFDVAGRHKAKYPALSRDTGAKVLELIYKGEARELDDAKEFAGDSLFCEYAYVLDLDKEVLEVYKGFNKGAVKGRFAKMDKAVFNGKTSEYSPISLFKKIPFSECGAQAVKQLVKDVTAYYEAQEEARA